MANKEKPKGRMIDGTSLYHRAIERINNLQAERDALKALVENIKAAVDAHIVCPSCDHDVCLFIADIDALVAGTERENHG